MNCTQAQDRFAELLDRRLDGARPAAMSAPTSPPAPLPARIRHPQPHARLARRPARPAAGPAPARQFLRSLGGGKTRRRQSPRRRPPPPRFPLALVLSPIAACALLAAGFFAGQRHAPVTTAPAPINPGNSEATTRELAALRLKVDSMSQLVGYSLLQQQPAGERLQGILAAQDLTAPVTAVITQLISALALDPSTNVRLSALEALYPHANQEVVRAGVLASLTREQNPLVQVSMIDFLVATRDRAATSTLEQLSRTDKVDRSVRDAAKRASSNSDPLQQLVTPAFAPPPPSTPTVYENHPSVSLPASRRCVHRAAVVPRAERPRR
jgi:hypothetical protein